MLRLSFYLAMIEGEAEQHKFEQLYWKFKGLMYYRAYEILQEEQAAEDAVSMAFLRIAQNIHKVGELDDPRTKGLIVTIADHIAIDLYRKRRREREHYAADFGAGRNVSSAHIGKRTGKFVDGSHPVIARAIQECAVVKVCGWL